TVAGAGCPLDREGLVDHRLPDDRRDVPIIVDDQHPGGARSRLGLIRRVVERRWSVSGGQPQGEDAPPAGLAVDGEGSVDERGEAGADRQSEPGAALRAGLRGADLLEGLEENSLVLETYADPGVCDGDRDARRVGPLKAQVDATPLGELDGVRQEVD